MTSTKYTIRHSRLGYHLAEEGKYRAVCNPKLMVMNTSIKLTDWGHTGGNTDINYKWCTECAKELHK